LDLGIVGAALATVISQGLAFLYSIQHSFRHRLIPLSRPTLPKKHEVSLILALGIPGGLQMAVIHAGIAAILSVVTGFGSDTVAGFSAAQRLDSLIMLPAMALGTAVNSMAGQNIGVGNWSRVKKIARYAS
ncbi:MATE family efflux transporter, partial [Acinetobacter baumannii]|nr:MATE family efflux transporter [Acinetobacter baumannii]